MKIADHIYFNGERGEGYRFDIEGQDFPWYISDRGPIITQLADDLYTVDVEIFCIDRDTHDDLPFLSNGKGAAPVIGGVEFPWLMTEGACTFTSKGGFPKVSLAFFARLVEAPRSYIRDMRDIFDCEGNLQKTLKPSEVS